MVCNKVHWLRQADYIYICIVLRLIQLHGVRMRNMLVSSASYCANGSLCCLLRSAGDSLLLPSFHWRELE